MEQVRYIVTTAPNAYDYNTASTLLAKVNSRGRTVRLVAVKTEVGGVDFLARYQADRYASGFHASVVCRDALDADDQYNELAQ